MKKIMLLLLLFLVIIGGIIGYRFYKQGGPQNPELVRMENIRFSNIEMPPNLAVSFNADVIVNNPNPIAITIAGMEFDVFLDTKKATTVKQDIKTRIPANNEFKMPLKFRIPLDDMNNLMDLGKIISGAWKNQSVEIKNDGKIFFDIANNRISIPFKNKDTYQLKDYL